MDIIPWNPQHIPSPPKRDALIAFLHQHLEAYGDSKDAISTCFQYVFNELPAHTTSGTVFEALQEGQTVGVCVVNETGMSAYIPEHILVYIATDAQHRGQGIGKQLLQHVLQAVTGSIALHVEADNPARKLYEKLGFTNRYLEMRFER